MEQTKGAVAPLGVLAEINARLAAITPEQFFMPPHKLQECMQVVGTASDDLKALFTLTHLLSEEKDIAFAAVTATPDLAEAEELHGVARRAEMLYSIVREAFWLDVRRQYPELAMKGHLAICDGWVLAYGPDMETPPPRMRMRIVTVGVGGLEAMLAGLHRH